MKKSILKKFTVYFVLAIIILSVLMPKSNAATEYGDLNERWFYIKNSYTGHYMDVYYGVAQGGTNVQQQEYNGSGAQKWYLANRGNGDYMICSEVGATDAGEGKINLNFSLDVDNGINENGTQIHLWNTSVDGVTQTFSFRKLTNNTFSIWTRCSNYTKVASLSDNLCDNGINIHQWEYSNHSHDEWILEPADAYVTMGVQYAKANYSKYLDAYPDLREYTTNSILNSTNFVSQCLLAGGQVHQNDGWYMKRKNTNYHEILNTSQLNNSWSYSNSWINAQAFRNNFNTSDREVYYCKGQDILNNPGIVWNRDIVTGDVVQMADYNSYGIGSSIYTYYITGYGTETVNGNSYSSYNLTYQSPSKLNKNLLELAKLYPNYYFVFYDFT